MKLFDHQKRLVDAFPKRHLLSWGTGTGKTVTAISLANKSGAGVLVICPKALKTQWEMNVRAHGGPGTWKIISKEEFKRDINSLLFYKTLIIDEAHHFFGMKSALSKALIFYIKKWKPEYLYLLTATPYRSTPWDVYRMLEIMGRKISYPAFLHQFFFEVKMGMRRISMPKKSDKAKEDLISLIRSVGSIVSLEDCFDVPEQTFETVYVETTKAQKKAIEKIDRVMPIERYMVEHQIVGGVTKGDEYEPSQRFESNKVSVLLDLIRDNRRMIVVCKYRAEVEMLQELVREEFPDKYIETIHGDVKDRHGVLEDVKDRADYVLIVAAQCSEGWELPACPLMVFYSHAWELTHWIQMKGRILRADALKKNTYISLVCKDTIDEDVYKTVVIDKADFHARIYDKGSLSTPLPS